MEAVRTAPRTPSVDAYVEAVTKLVEAHPGAWGASVPTVVESHGVRFHPTLWKTWRGRGYRLGRPQECFKNAFNLSVRHPELTYVEGLAVAAAGFSVHHAWCVTEDGSVVEPTWRDGRLPVGEREYRGVPFTSEALFDILASKMKDGRGTYGVLDARVIYEAFDPAWLP